MAHLQIPGHEHQKPREVTLEEVRLLWAIATCVPLVKHAPSWCLVWVIHMLGSCLLVRLLAVMKISRVNPS
jgi:hypothetical protein